MNEKLDPATCAYIWIRPNTRRISWLVRVRDRISRKAASATLGVVLSAIGFAATMAAGFLGWTLVQNYHVGVHLVPEQERAEPAVQHSQPSLPRRNAA
jgi:hypothetical protein